MRSLGLFVGHVAKAVRHDTDADREMAEAPPHANPTNANPTPVDGQTVERIEDPATGKVILRRTTTSTTTDTTIEEVEVDRPER